MADNSFFIAGIGYSAGGMTALLDFLQCLPEEPGAAFVIIPHLYPTFKSQLDEILAKHSKMPIHKVTGVTEVKINHMYLLEENTELHISGNKLYTTARPSQPINNAIDAFFFSLAENSKEKAIGIILSGMGKDGGEGAKSIHDHGGFVLVQHPDTALYADMPNNIIRTDDPYFISSPCLIAKFLHNMIMQPAQL